MAQALTDDEKELIRLLAVLRAQTKEYVASIDRFAAELPRRFKALKAAAA